MDLQKYKEGRLKEAPWLADLLREAKDELAAEPLVLAGDTIEEKRHILKLLETTPFIWEGKPYLGINSLLPSQAQAVYEHILWGGEIVLRRLSHDAHATLKRARREPFKWNGIGFLRSDCMTKEEFPDFVAGLLSGDDIEFQYDD